MEYVKIGDKINITFLKEGVERATQTRELITRELKIISETPIGYDEDKKVNIYDEDLQERCAAHNVVIEGTNLFNAIENIIEGSEVIYKA